MHTDKHQLSSSFCCGFSSTLCLPHKPVPRQQISCSQWKLLYKWDSQKEQWRSSHTASQKIPSSLYRCRPSLPLVCGHLNPTEVMQRWWSLSPRSCAIPSVIHQMPLQSVLWVLLLFFISVVPAHPSADEKLWRSLADAAVSEWTSAAGFAREIRTCMAKDGLTGFINVAK